MQRHVLRPASGTERSAVCDIKELIALRVGSGQVPRDLRIHRDTTNFLAIDTGEVILLGEVPYFVRGHAREGRFGLDDEPKLWVKRAIDLRGGEAKIIKLSFRESFTLRIGSTSVDCVRSPLKEARILSLVGEDRRFMKGHAVEDTAGNVVRVLDYIRGPTLADVVQEGDDDHETYFHTVFPSLLEDFTALAGAIGYLHRRSEKHGDIRRDHVLFDRRHDCWRWIDFDYNYHHPVNPYGYDLFGLGNILIFLAGKGDITPRDLKGRSPPAHLQAGDMNIIFPNRVADVGRIYPYVPIEFRRVLRHFSAGAEVYYESVEVFLEDLEEARDALRRAAGDHRKAREVAND